MLREGLSSIGCAATCCGVSLELSPGSGGRGPGGVAGSRRVRLLPDAGWADGWTRTSDGLGRYAFLETLEKRPVPQDCGGDNSDISTPSHSDTTSSKQTLSHHQPKTRARARPSST
jgi:hypothetical protein